MSERQPIETAPKDGTRIRLFGADWEKVGRWFPAHERAAYEGGEESDFASIWIADDGEEYLEPTHWAPEAGVTVGALAPPSFVFSSANSKELFRILPSGEVVLAEGVEVSEASACFFEALKNMGMDIVERAYQRGLADGLAKRNADG